MKTHNKRTAKLIDFWRSYLCFDFILKQAALAPLKINQFFCFLGMSMLLYTFSRQFYTIPFSQSSHAFLLKRNGVDIFQSIKLQYLKKIVCALHIKWVSCMQKCCIIGWLNFLRSGLHMSRTLLLNHSVCYWHHRKIFALYFVHQWPSNNTLLSSRLFLVCTPHSADTFKVCGTTAPRTLK